MTTRTATRSIVGVDLGQANDYTAITVLRPGDEADHPVFTAGHVERVPLNTRYPDIVDHIANLVTALRQAPADPVIETIGGVRFSKPARKPDVDLVVDYTGVGRPVADMLREARLDCNLILVTITGGDSVTIDQEYSAFRVPKRDLASVIQRLLQEHRLIVPSELPMAETLTRELTGFRVKINLRGHDSYGAGEDWRSAAHDDLVLGLALACWWADRPGPEIRIW